MLSMYARGLTRRFPLSMGALSHSRRGITVQQTTSEPVGTYEDVEKHLSTINYKPILGMKDTQVAIWKLKKFIEENLHSDLNLMRVECPLVVDSTRGVNDLLDRDLSKMPVAFNIKNDHKNPVDAQIVQASTKWKRMALAQYGLQSHEGLFCDMRAIRKDEFIDHDHSSYVSQWDWEIAIDKQDLKYEYLFDVVKKLYKVLWSAEQMILSEYPQLGDTGVKPLPEEITFVHCADLLEKYPTLDRKARENAILQEKGAVFLTGIGYPLANGEPHEMRASDYDDWSTEAAWPLDGRKLHGLNGDIMVFNQVTGLRHELSSMGIRVTKDALKLQLKMSDQEDFSKWSYHQAIFNDQVPLSIGGGIGQSRTFMYMLRKAQIGEVEVSVWPQYFRDMLKKYNINVLV